MRATLLENALAKRARLLVLTILVLPVIACGGGGDSSNAGGGGGGGGGGTTPPPPTGPTRVPHLTVVSGDAQKQKAGLPLGDQVLVQVNDDKGIALENVSVHVAVTGGTGSLTTDAQTVAANELTVRTTASGAAAFHWRLGADTVRQLVRITAESSPDSLNVSATILRLPYISAFSGSDQRGQAGDTISDPIVVNVHDRAGFPFAGAAVSWLNASALAHVVEGDTLSDAAGHVSAHVALGGTPGATTVSVVGPRQQVIVFPVTIVAGSAVTLSAVPSALTYQMEGMRTRIVVTGRDRFGNALPGLPLQWSSSDAGVATVSSDGVVRASEVGTASVIATYGSVKVSVPVSFVQSASVVELGGLTCGLGTDSHVVCWSWDGTDTGRVLGSLPAVRQLAAGGNIPNFCALTADARTLCWGNNHNGELGGGPSILDDTRDATNPVTVVGSHVFTQVARGSSHTCALTADGTAFCWGLDYYIGTDTTAASCVAATECISVPVAVSGGLHFRGLSGIAQFTCGVTSTNDGYCWGLGEAAWLGARPLDICWVSEPCARTPVLVQGGQHWRMIGAGGQHACGLADDGETYCWGANGHGALGTGSRLPDTSSVPLRVVGGYHFGSLSVGGDGACGLTADGKAYCWGMDVLTQPTPVRADLVFTSIALSTSTDFVGCGISAKGGVHCWSNPLAAGRSLGSKALGALVRRRQ